MPFQRQRAELRIDDGVRLELERISRSRTESGRRVERAKLLLGYVAGEPISAIARSLNTNRPKVYRCVRKALDVGALPALDDLPRRGRPATILAGSRAWLVALACRKPAELGYAEELWTVRRLAEHARRHCRNAGHPDLRSVAPGTVSKILAHQEVRPHKITYYLERRDPAFDEKMAQVLCFYREVALLREWGKDPDAPLVAYLSYDEKPGIQAVGTTSPDRPPVPGEHATVGRDPEYVRHGTVTLMAGMDLLTGHVHRAVVDRHRSREFVEFLRGLDKAYPKNRTLRLILDNHSVHLSRETRTWLASVPNRFEFVFTPKHASWLNLIETFFSKVARTVLRGIRVASTDELKERLERYIDGINAEPVVFKWTYGINDAIRV